MTDSRLVYTAVSPHGLWTTNFGVTLRNERTGRMEIHFGVPVHVVNNDTPRSETMFRYSRYEGVLAVRGNADELTIKVVDVLAKYAIVPFDEHRGIRLAESYIDDVYASCAVVRLPNRVSTEKLLDELGAAINGEHGETLFSHLDTYGEESRQERIDMANWNLLD